MHQVFIEGGLIRKLWGVERDAYRDHLLRLDAESRRNRFCGTIADSIIRTLPIRLLPTPPTCRMLPGSGVKLCVGKVR